MQSFALNYPYTPILKLYNEEKTIVVKEHKN